MAAESEADSQEGPGASRVWGREKGENLKVTERVALGEYGADRGRGFGPYLRDGVSMAASWVVVRDVHGADKLEVASLDVAAPVRLRHQSHLHVCAPKELLHQRNCTSLTVLSYAWTHI